jgi:hypothetical protein
VLVKVDLYVLPAAAACLGEQHGDGVPAGIGRWPVLCRRESLFGVRVEYHVRRWPGSVGPDQQRFPVQDHVCPAARSAADVRRFALAGQPCVDVATALAAFQGHWFRRPVLARDAGYVFAERPERHGGSPLVDGFRGTEIARNPACLPASHLSAVFLWFSLGQQHPVGQVGKLARHGFAALDRFRHQVQALALERRILVGVLRQQPGRARAPSSPTIDRPGQPTSATRPRSQARFSASTDANVSAPGSSSPRAA